MPQSDQPRKKDIPIGFFETPGKPWNEDEFRVSDQSDSKTDKLKTGKLKNG
jgi:hypothetical protein